MVSTLCIQRMGGQKWDAARLLNPHYPAFRPQKSDPKNVHLALPSRSPEESFGQSNPDPGLCHLKPG